MSTATAAPAPVTAPPRPRRGAPGPLVILGGLFVAVAAASSILSWTGVTTTGSDGKSTPVLAFLSGDGIVNLLSTAVDNFVDFPALGVTLTMVLGLGVAQGTGALEAAVRMAFAKVPARAVPYGVAFLCCQGHVLSDGSFILLPALAMQIFKAKGRNPLAGLVAGLACVSVGYGGGLIFGTSDVGYTAVTTSAAASVRGVPHYVTGVTMNWFITATVGVILPIVLGWVTVHILEPSIGEAAPTQGDSGDEPRVTALQRRGVIVGLLAVATFVALVVAWWLVPSSPLRGDNGELIESPFLQNLVPILALAFVVFGVVYGRVAKLPAEERQLLPLMSGSIREMAGFIVIVFVLAQVISVLTWTKLSTFLAVGIASGLEHAGLTGYWALIALAILTALLSVFIGGTALWGLEAPVLVPALMMTGLAPAALQIGFRMAVCWGSVMSPANVFIYFTYNEARKIDPTVTIGWLIRRTAYFVLPGALTWFAVLAVFYVAGLPVGPGVSLKLG